MKKNQSQRGLSDTFLENKLTQSATKIKKWKIQY
jgi:hypothetical protein